VTHKDRDLELMKAAKEDVDCPCVMGRYFTCLEIYSTRPRLKSIARLPTTCTGPLKDTDAICAGHWVPSLVLRPSFLG
jgi:hypothetical protein